MKVRIRKYLLFLIVLTMCLPCDFVRASDNTIKTIIGGSNRCMVIKNDDSLWFWGWTARPFADTEHISIPIKIMDDVKTASLGYDHIAVIKNDNSLWLWGNNDSGKVGVENEKVVLSPTKVMDNVSYVATGFTCTLAIKMDGSLWAWGSNSEGQLGDGTKENITSPVKVMDDVVSVWATESVGMTYTVAIKTDGSLWAWGKGWEDLCESYSGDIVKPFKLMDNVESVSVGYSCMAIKKDKSLWFWDRKNHVETKGNTTYNTSRYKEPVKLLDGVIAVKQELYQYAALQSNGGLWMWGENKNGQLGDGTQEDRSEPVYVLDDVKFFSIDRSHSAAVKNDGSLWTWGSNKDGQLGDGTTEDRYTPVKIMGDAIDVSITWGNMALKQDRSLWTWGSSVLGNDSGVRSLIPKKVLAFEKQTVQTLDDNVIKVFWNNNIIEFDSQPIIKDGRTLVPIRAIAEAMGCEVFWDGETRTINIRRHDIVIGMQIDNNLVTVSKRIVVYDYNRIIGYASGEDGDYTIYDYHYDNEDTVIELDVPPQIYKGRTLVPVRVVAEAFGARVEWDAQTRSVMIYPR